MGYTAIQAARLSGCSTAQVDAWRRIGLVVPVDADPAGPYSFRDLVGLKVVKSLLDGGMSLQRVRRSWDYLSRRADLAQHLSEVKLVTDGVSIFKVCRTNGEILDALRDGQLAFFVAIDEVARSVDDSVTHEW